MDKAKGFATAFYQLDKEHQALMKKALCKEMGWSEVTFFSKRNGHRKVKFAELIVLRQMFAGYGIEL